MVIPGKDKYKATLIYQPHGGSATMTAWNQTTTVNGDTLSGPNGTETVVVDQITAAPGYYLVGVVATTASGTVNATETASGHWEYTMVEQDVEMRVVFAPDDDPKKDKGPYMVTVYKVGDDGHADNDATVEDLDVVIPNDQKGTIWTAAYEGNTVRVDVTDRKSVV